MKKVKKWRYYCDHCGKGGCASGHIARHEKHCIYNPERACRMCEYATGEKEQTRPTRDLMEALNTSDMDGLKELAQHCPACILAAIVQTKRAMEAAGTYRPEEDYIDFDYKKAVADMWTEANAIRADREYRHPHHIYP